MNRCIGGAAYPGGEPYGQRNEDRGEHDSPQCGGYKERRHGILPWIT